MPIFAILFGFSLDKLYQSMKSKQIKRPRIKLLRRAIFLLILGSLHAYFIWEGDILFGYALSMLIVILFISLNRKFFKWITIIGFGLILAMSVGSLFDTSSPIIETSDKASYVHEVKTLYSEGSYWDIREADDTIQDPKFMQLKSMLGDNMGWLFVMILFIEFVFYFRYMFIKI